MKKEWIEYVDKAIEQDPRKYPIGVYSVDCSAGIFTWFKTWEQARAFMVDILPAVWCDPDDGEDNAREYRLMRDKLVALWEKVDSLSGVTDAKVCKMNEILGDQSVLWIGSFAALCADEAPFCARLREGFREDADESDNSRPIEPDETASFIEYAKHFGI